MDERQILDTSVYPDLDDPPAHLNEDAERADYVARICGAWDFGLLPTPETFALFAGWRTVFDRYPLAHSPAYAAFRMTYGWPPLPISLVEAPWEVADRRAGRPWPDSCLDLV